MINIHLFETAAEHDAARGGSEYIEPWVSFTEQTETVDYNKSEEEKLRSTPLTLKVKSSGNIVWGIYGDWTGSPQVIEYKKNSGEWTEASITTGSPLQISVANGDSVQFRGDNTSYLVWGDYGQFETRLNGSTCSFDAEGNIMSIFDSDDFATMTEFSETYSTPGTLFTTCTGLVSASKLVLPALTNPVYQGMFSGCTSLTEAPNLPATSITENSYKSMFQNCASLVKPPKTLAIVIQNGPFGDGAQCARMFAGCTSLTKTPELPATTLGATCYQAMFAGCTSLTEAPELPATGLNSNCYAGMFSGCTSLTKAPELPATVLSYYCYASMFAGCTGLTNAPELPATALTNNCYDGMFSGCTNLTSAPELKATTLANNCYSSMFVGCTNLVSAPELPAATLVNRCYQFMFDRCSKLSYVKCLATTISATNSHESWLRNVSSTGTFVKSPDITAATWGSGGSGIPSNWTVQDAS